jgi:folate-binding protein YgfZ
MAHPIARTLIAVEGPEARAFLQNLLTQDLDRLDREPCVYAALLSPQGKVQADMFVWRDGEDLWLDIDPARGADILRRLSLYKLRAAVTLREVSAERGVWVSDEAFEGAISDPRLPALGWRGLGAAHASDEGAPALQSRQVSFGVPDLARDAGPEEVFALEALLEELNGVAFHKGCFVGQENVSRMKRRATTRKKFCPVAFEGPAPAYGTPVTAGEAELGSVRSGVEGRALALLRLDRALAAHRLSAGGIVLTLDPPPWLLLPSPDG